MNGQLPPTDPVLRKQLARRSSGRLPENLLTETMARLDATPKTAARPVGRAMRMPRLAWAGVALAAVAVLAVGVALPAISPRPAGFVSGYPAQRALTAAELAELMAGPELATNTAIVASVTIQSRNDVCPMNRYPTLGVIEGIDSQVCVMGAGVHEYFTNDEVSGVFAFRYLAPGVLGLLAELTPAPSQLAFDVAGEWPEDGSAFLVEGYLGATAVPCADETPAAGDVLFPNGYEQCRWSWLSDDGSPAAVQSLPTWSPAAEPTAVPSIDLLALDGKARHVEAGGARLIDSIPDATAHGVYVVAPVTGPCPGAAPYDSRGCSVWRVLAKVPELALTDRPAPTPSPTPTAVQVDPDGLWAPPIARVVAPFGPAERLGRVLHVGSIAAARVPGVAATPLAFVHGAHRSRRPQSRPNVRAGGSTGAGAHLGTCVLAQSHVVSPHARSERS
jgi:hypothetical protein